MSDADHSRRRQGLGWLEKGVQFHFGSLLVFTTWAFGGQAPWVRQGIAGWGAGGVLLFIAACVRRKQSGGAQSGPNADHRARACGTHRLAKCKGRGFE